MKTNQWKLIKDKHMLVPVMEYLELVKNGSRGSAGQSVDMERLESQADILAQENTQLLEENHRLDRELRALRERTDQPTKADRCHDFIVWLATVGRTGNFLWKDVRPLLRKGDVDGALEQVEERAGIRLGVDRADEPEEDTGVVEVKAG